MDMTAKMEILRGMVGDEKDAVLVAYLKAAAAAVIAKAYPFRSDIDKVPDKYAMRQVEIAAYLINKRGAEGQLSHSENGISRSYESGDVPESMLKGITPYCGVVQ